jgi:hypothetical protein
MVIQLVIYKAGHLPKVQYPTTCPSIEKRKGGAGDGRCQRFIFIFDK